jgi:hypothetical protein
MIMTNEKTENDKAIEEFLANGGVIKTIPAGETGLEEGALNPWKRGPGRPKASDKKQS